ncbi:hypothetical protein FRB94_002822 [Tulasnella sp. JGI-2019a]|nr:hypothetical protein FRB94_002822 [Tulasnella sp. JGI-2019a]
MRALSRLFKRSLQAPRRGPSLILRLPTELILLLLCYMDLCDMGALLQTCQELKAIVEHAMYTTVEIPNTRWGPRTYEFVRTLHARPDLARRISSFGGYLYPIFDGVVSGISTRIPGGYFTLPPNLRSLYLHDHDWWWNPAFFPAYSSVSHLALTSLTIRGSGYRGVHGISFEPDIAPILRLQPLLEHLDLRLGQWNMETLGPYDIPDLTTLSAGVDEARFIVPGRPITSLKLSIRRMEEDEAWRNMSASTRRMSSLTLDVLRCGMLLCVTLEMAAMYMVHTENLTIHSLKAHDITPAIDMFGSFSNLRTLRIKINKDSEDTPAVDSIQEALMEECKRACPSLQILSVEYYEGLLGSSCPAPKPEEGPHWRRGTYRYSHSQTHTDTTL